MFSYFISLFLCPVVLSYQCQYMYFCSFQEQIKQCKRANLLCNNWIFENLGKTNKQTLFQSREDTHIMLQYRIFQKIFKKPCFTKYAIKANSKVLLGYTKGRNTKVVQTQSFDKGFPLYKMRIKYAQCVYKLLIAC